MAQVTLRAQAQRSGLEGMINIDSAGTHASQVSEKPDPRAEAALLRRGYEIGRLRSRKVSPRDFSKFDLIFAMDSANLASLQKLCPPDHSHKLHLFLAYGGPDGATSVLNSAQSAPTVPLEIPDPYYGNVDGFERVLDLCEAGARRILAKLATLP